MKLIRVIKITKGAKEKLEAMGYAVMICGGRKKTWTRHVKLME